MAESKKLSLASYGKKKPEPVLTAVPEAKVEQKDSTPRVRSVKQKSVGGRPPKPAEEKRSVKMTMYLTDAEKAVLDEKRGLVAGATFLLNELRSNGLFDPKE